jgi:hypothetical protein
VLRFGDRARDPQFASLGRGVVPLPDATVSVIAFDREVARRNGKRLAIGLDQVALDEKPVARDVLDLEAKEWAPAVRAADI